MARILVWLAAAFAWMPLEALARSTRYDRGVLRLYTIVSVIAVAVIYGLAEKTDERIQRSRRRRAEMRAISAIWQTAEMRAISAIWPKEGVLNLRQTAAMLHADFLDRYREACDELGVEPLPLPDLERLVQLLTHELGQARDSLQ